MLKTTITIYLLCISFSMSAQILWEKDLPLEDTFDPQIATTSSGEIIITDWFSITKLSTDGDIIFTKDLPDHGARSDFFFTTLIDDTVHQFEFFDKPFLARYDLEGVLMDKVDIPHLDDFLIVTEIKAIDSENFALFGRSRSSTMLFIFNTTEGTLFTTDADWFDVRNGFVFYENADRLNKLLIDQNSMQVITVASIHICGGESFNWLVPEDFIACRESNAENETGDGYTLFNINNGFLIGEFRRQIINNLYQPGASQLEKLIFGQLDRNCQYGIQRIDDQIEIFYGSPRTFMDNLIFDFSGRIQHTFVSENELDGINIGFYIRDRNFLGFKILKLDRLCYSSDNNIPQAPDSQYATFSGGVEGTGSFNCFGMPDFTYSVTGDVAPGDTSVPGPNQVIDNNGGGFETVFGEADEQENIEIEVATYTGSVGDPITNEVVTTLEFESVVTPDQLSFIIADVEQDQVQISALDEQGNPIPTSVIATWFERSFDADNFDPFSTPPTWDAESSTLVGHLAIGGVRQTVYQQDLPDTEAAAAWFTVNVPIKTLKFTSQALGIQPDDPAMHFIFASRCEDQFSLSLAITSILPESPLKPGDVYQIELETCNVGFQDLVDVQIGSFEQTGLTEVDRNNVDFDLAANTCVTSSVSYQISDDYNESQISQEFYVQSDTEVQSIIFNLDVDLSEEPNEMQADGPYLDNYPWLENELSSANCAALSITEFDLSAFSFIYLSDGRLYFEDGTFYCQDSDNRDCRVLYNLNREQITNRWDCGENQNENENENGNESKNENESGLPVSAYPWISDTASGFICSDLSIHEYDLGAFTFVYLEDNDQGSLYFEDGTFYCKNSESTDCRALYNLSESEITNSWICEGNENENENENQSTDFFSEYPWIAGFLNPDCSNGSIEEFKDGNFSFFLIDNGDEVALYFQDGTFYCQQTETYSCIEAYGFGQPVRSHICDGQPIIHTEERSNIALKQYASFISVSPNPSSGIFRISHQLQNADIFVFDVTGKLIRRAHTQRANKSMIDLSDQESGLYILKVLMDNQSISKKIIKL